MSPVPLLLVILICIGLIVDSRVPFLPAHASVVLVILMVVLLIFVLLRSLGFA
jgi:hypothetical protein